MSDENITTTPAAPAADAGPAASPVAATAAQALAVKELGETIVGVKRQLKVLWIAVAVMAVGVVAVLVLTFVPGLRFGMMGGPGRGTFNRANGTFQGAPGNFQGNIQGGQQGGTTQP